MDYYSNKKAEGSNPTSEEKEEEKSGNEKRPMRYVFLLGILPMVNKQLFLSGCERQPLSIEGFHCSADFNNYCHLNVLS